VFSRIYENINFPKKGRTMGLSSMIENPFNFMLSRLFLSIPLFELDGFIDIRLKDFLKFLDR